MKKGLIASLRVGLAAFVMLFATNLLPVAATVYADKNPNPNPPGNNGTLKVHEIGTPSGTENNDPKVCTFNLEGFGFDPSQSGYINIDVQGGDGPAGVSTGPYSFGPTDASGYAVSQDFNTVGGTPIVTGHYKATLYGKDTGGNINLTDEKAKSKVFKVDCAPTEVTPVGVTFIDLCGIANDTYTVSSTTGVTYHLGTAAGAVVTANTYAGSGTVTVVAVANAGFVLSAPYTFSHTFTNVACDSHVTPGAVSFNEMCGIANDTYTVPSTTGVTYHLGTPAGPEVGAGTYGGTNTVTVVAVANPGFVSDGVISWTYDFTDTPCPLIPVTTGEVTYVDICGTADDKYTVPTTPNVTYKIGANVVTAGTQTGTGTVTITAYANAGYELTAPYTFTHTFTNDPCDDSDVSLCHATGSSTNNPYVLIPHISAAGAFNGHLDDGSGGTKGDHQNGKDIIPPFVFLGHTYSQNWDAVGMAIFHNDCDVLPIVDVCPNIAGPQTTLPEGMVKDAEGNCVTPPVDVCPNINGNQATIPAGMVKDAEGDCVTPPGCGYRCLP